MNGCTNYPAGARDRITLDASTGEEEYIGPAPEAPFYASETVEEAMVMIAKLFMRPNDTSRGRSVKLGHYIDLHRRSYGTMPTDLHLYVRKAQDISINMRKELRGILEEVELIEDEIAIPGPILLIKRLKSEYVSHMLARKEYRDVYWSQLGVMLRW